MIVSLTAAHRPAPGASGPPYPDWHRTGGVSACCSSRGAVDLFAHSLAAELHGTGVAVNTVALVNPVITPVVQAALDAGEIAADRFTAPKNPEVMAEAMPALCPVDPATQTGMTTCSGQCLAEIGRPVRGRDGGPFAARITTASMRY